MFFNFNPMFDFRNIEKQAISNPKFKEFYDANKNKSIEDICKENNLDFNTITALKKMLNI